MSEQSSCFQLVEHSGAHSPCRALSARKGSSDALGHVDDATPSVINPIIRRVLVPTPSTAASRLDCANVLRRCNGFVWGLVRRLVSGRGGAPRTGVPRGNTPTPTPAETTLSRGAHKHPRLWSQKRLLLRC